MFTLQTHSLEYLSSLVLNSREDSGSSRNNHKLPPRIESEQGSGDHLQTSNGYFLKTFTNLGVAAS